MILWKDSEAYSIARQSDAEGSRYAFVVEVKKPPPLDRWSLIDGDCIHNLRSALDALIYALAVRDSGSNPPPVERSLQFPITGSVGDFNRSLAMIRPLAPGTQTRIERAQPYNRWHPQLPPLLCLLNKFDNLDKHRLLNVVIANAAQGHLRFDYTGYELPSFKLFHHSGAIESGAELAYVMFTPPKPDVNCKYEATIVISIAHPAGPSGRTTGELIYILEVLIEEVRGIVDRIIL
jgi:hypothetical protein